MLPRNHLPRSSRVVWGGLRVRARCAVNSSHHAFERTILIPVFFRISIHPFGSVYILLTRTISKHRPIQGDISLVRRPHPARTISVGRHPLELHSPCVCGVSVSPPPSQPTPTTATTTRQRPPPTPGPAGSSEQTIAPHHLTAYLHTHITSSKQKLPLNN